MLQPSWSSLGMHLVICLHLLIIHFVSEACSYTANVFIVAMSRNRVSFVCAKLESWIRVAQA